MKLTQASDISDIPSKGEKHIHIIFLSSEVGGDATSEMGIAGIETC